MTLAFMLAFSVSAPSPTVAVAAPMARGVDATHVEAAFHQVRAAVRKADFEVIDLESCRGLDCVPAGRCDYLLLTRLLARAGEIDVRLELIAVRSGEVLAASLNSAPLAHGTATLDLPLLVAEVLAVLTAPSRLPRSSEPVVVVVESEEEPVAPVARVESVAPVVPAPARTGLSVPRSEPVPREGIWVGHCVSHPEFGTNVYLEPADWERYRRHRERARHPLPVRRWIEKQNEESWGLNLAWITPPVLLALGLIADSTELAVAGGGTLPVAAIAAIVDVADVGSIDGCQPRR